MVAADRAQSPPIRYSGQNFDTKIDTMQQRMSDLLRFWTGSGYQALIEITK
jgi:hypothetical protein